MYVIFLYFVFIIVSLCYILIKWNFSYWKRLGLNYLEPEFLFGNTRELTNRKLSVGEQFAKLYFELKKKGYKHGGIFSFFRPTYIPVDLDMIKNITIKDSDYFINHGIYYNERVNPLSGHLFNLEDEKWRMLRAKLTPSFTASKVKMMFQTVLECSKDLKQLLTEHARRQDPVDMKEFFARYATDVIGSVAFGLDCKSLKNPDSKFRENGRKLFDSGWKNQIRQLITFVIPKGFLHTINFNIIDKSVEDFFLDVVRDTVNFRENNNVFRKDFMHIMLQLKNRGKVADDEFIFKKNREADGPDFLTFNELAAQCFLFFMAGFETSATTMSFALLELALNLDIQEKLRKELKSVLDKYNGQLTYDGVKDMKYLDLVVHETLRKHPPSPSLPRICNKAYRVPDTNIVIEKGTTVIIPILAIQRDPDNYPDPEKFDPERFTDENGAKRHPCAFMSFGGGPRYCLGSRFGLLQTKVGIITVLSNFKVNLHNKTRLPIKYVTQNFILAVDGGVWLQLSKTEEN